MDQKGIDRINELARKAKTQELTPEEKKEQHKLRKEFIASVRMNLRSPVSYTHLDVYKRQLVFWRYRRYNRT